MDVIEELTEIVNKLDKLDEYDSTLSDKLSELDQKQQDLLHYIEFNKINILWCYRMIKEIKNIREQRRKVKNDMDLYNKFHEHKNKLLSKENRKFLLTEIHKREKINSIPYKNRKYTDEEIQKVLKGM